MKLKTLVVIRTKAYVYDDGDGGVVSDASTREEPAGGDVQ